VAETEKTGDTMKLDLASPADNQELLKFFSEFSTRGLVDLKPDRGADFFADYKIQTDSYKTYVLRDEADKIQAMASFLFRDTSFGGATVPIATATDLRVTNTRHAILDWTHHFLPVMNEVTHENHLSSIFSVINLSDPLALNSFIRPRNMKRLLPKYYLYRKFFMTSIHGRYPWTKGPLSSIQIRQGSSANVDALLSYIIRRNSFRPFASVWDEASFQKKIARLNGFQLSDFLVAFDNNDNVIGCLAPWKATGISDYIPLSYSLRAHNFRQYLKFLWLFGLTRRLAKPVSSTGRETHFQYRHLTFVNADNEDIFESLIATAYETVTSHEFLLYAHVEQDYRLLPSESWISASQPYALYSVVPPDQEMPAFLHPSLSENPEIESCYFF
jgi:hypothetical protein